MRIIIELEGVAAARATTEPSPGQAGQVMDAGMSTAFQLGLAAEASPTAIVGAGIPAALDAGGPAPELVAALERAVAPAQRDTVVTPLTAGRPSAVGATPAGTAPEREYELYRDPSGEPRWRMPHGGGM